MLGEDEDLLHEISIEMKPEDGVIHAYGTHAYGTDDNGITAFTDLGIENLSEFLKIHRKRTAQDRAAPVSPTPQRS
jgi:hypothetical protein